MSHKIFHFMLKRLHVGHSFLLECFKNEFTVMYVSKICFASMYVYASKQYLNDIQ